MTIYHMSGNSNRLIIAFKQFLEYMISNVPRIAVDADKIIKNDYG